MSDHDDRHDELDDDLDLEEDATFKRDPYSQSNPLADVARRVKQFFLEIGRGGWGRVESVRLNAEEEALLTRLFMEKGMSEQGARAAARGRRRDEHAPAWAGRARKDHLARESEHSLTFKEWLDQQGEKD